MFDFTHYVEDRDGPWVTALSVETCENCEGLVEASNAVGLKRNDARRLKLKTLLRRPPEQYWSDSVGGCVCQECDPDF